MPPKRKYTDVDITTIQTSKEAKKIFDARIEALDKNWISEEAWTTANSWKAEREVEEFVDFIFDDNIFKTDYEYINNLLLYIFFNKKKQKELENFIKNEIKESYAKFIIHYDNKKEYVRNSNDNKITISNLSNFIEKIIETAKTLCEALDTFPTWKEIYPNFEGLNLYLYHGLEFNEIKLFNYLFKNMNPGTPFEWPLFMSTSFDKNVALRFAHSGGPEFPNKILIKIIVPISVYDKIKYTYLGDHITITPKMVQFDSEVELLLNLSVRFKYIRKDTKKYSYTILDVVNSKMVEIQKNELFDIYFFEFIEYKNNCKVLQYLKNIKLFSSLSKFGKFNFGKYNQSIF